MDKYIGKRLDGRYEIHELIGVGGMANVYRCTDTVDDREVAIKILKDEYLNNEEFIRRFSANKSKSRQATSRRKLLEKISIEDIPASSRRYPWVGFKIEREPGKDRLFVTDVSKTIDGVKVLDNISFIMDKGDKIAIIGQNEIAITTLFKILAGEIEPDSGTVKWGVSTTQAYFPKDNSEYFDGVDLNIMEWMRTFSEDMRESYLRTF